MDRGVHEFVANGDLVEDLRTQPSRQRATEALSMTDQSSHPQGVPRRRTALITGASGGIGYELAKLFARDGYDLVLVARSVPKLEELAHELSVRHGMRALVIPADLS